MSDSEDDRPLVKAKSSATISKATDAAMDREVPTHNGVAPGVSMAMGPVTEMDIDEPITNGHAAGSKRKASLGKGKSYKDDSGSDDDDDVPLTKRRKTADSNSDSEDDKPLVKKVVKPIKATAHQIGEDSDDEVPLGVKLQETKAKIEKAAEKEAVKLRKEDKVAESKKKSKKKSSDDEDDDVPLKKKAKPAAKTNGTTKVKKEDSDDDDVPLVRKAPAAKKGKAEAATPKKKGKKDAESPGNEDAEPEEEEYRWWEDTAKGDGTKKWSTLEHNGVIFPPEYEPLPANVSLFYDGKPVKMHAVPEEIAHAFGAMLNSTHNVENPTFQKNFMEDFREALKQNGGAKDKKSGEKVDIKHFDKLDFQHIFNHVDAERQAKKALSAAEKKQKKAEKDAIEAPFLYCTWDGRKQKVGNFRVEPPGLFRGRGEHPKTGKWKKRVSPEQITINIGKEAMVPAPPVGHKWKEIKNDNEGTWLVMWQENVNGNYKYVMLAANSDVKGQSDFKKFEKARELKKHIDKIRKDYHRELKSDVMAERQRATAVYLIDQFALRAGNEKGDDEADTVGCCSLKFEHITLRKPDTVIFDFLGKDSIRFYSEVKVDPQVFKNLKIFKRDPKQDGDDIFDRLTTSALNKHLSNYMPGLTAKVFRTYNASFTMATLLKEMKKAPNAAEQMKDYNDANRKVAILCNHKRTVGAGHATQMEKMDTKIDGMRYQQWRLKQMMLDLDDKLKKKRGAAFFELPEGMTQDWIKEHQASLIEAEKVKITKKFEKENEKLEAEDQKAMKPKELESRLEVVKELESKFKKENKTGKVEAEGKGATVERFETQIEKLEQRIAVARVQSEDRENNKEVALSTSKINYIDPRLTVVFCKKFGVPIEKPFSKTMREKFDWAIKSVDEDWEF
ncbi:hypothetical protein B0A48_14454 [Cryoendolithus antarcticus]|uniref:DNA topoisomerase I n=1 Tax=Cryoendolithus antarcticus TaxID=1507870 RepID=A0A1V8SJZ3_9PEZI|nr:hypothetical protein B0A48_14454 [Cryoendolithus antarcticus]